LKVIKIYFPEHFKKWVGVGYDRGPSQVINLISSQTSCSQLSFNSNQNKSIEYFADYINERGYLGLVCGTSLSDSGSQVELNIKKAFNLLGLPVVCIEDFPGNFRSINGCDVDLLILESGFSKNIYEGRYTILPEIIICPSIRYDHLRQQNCEPKQFIKDKKSLNSVLWVGQPEFDSNLYTLKTLIPVLKKLSVTLLFKAHPGDMDYTKGSYAKYFDEIGLHWVDVTNSKVDSNLFKQCNLIITQFSSLAIEAGFHGVPSLNVLFENAGKKLLLERTGSLTTNSISHGASFVIWEEYDGMFEYIRMCLTDLNARENVLLNFNHLYDTQRVQLPRLLEEIKDIIPNIMYR
jgi:hypothetical protein